MFESAIPREETNIMVPDNYGKSVFPRFTEMLTRRNCWHLIRTHKFVWRLGISRTSLQLISRCSVELHHLIAHDCSLRTFSHTCVLDTGLRSQVFPSRSISRDQRPHRETSNLWINAVITRHLAVSRQRKMSTILLAECTFRVLLINRFFTTYVVNTTVI